jgi:hypothetical protein
VRPTTRELVDGIANALERQVAPAVQDKWAASVLRSALQLLRHVSVRVEDEARLLAEDNADATRVLEHAMQRLRGRAEFDALHARIVRALEIEPVPPHDAVALAERNDVLQSMFEELLRHPEKLGDADGAVALNSAREYLQRRLAREQHWYFPVFNGTPF